MKIIINKSLLIFICLLFSCSAIASPITSPVHTNYKNEISIAATDPNHFELIAAAGIMQLNAGHSFIGITTNETDELIQTNDNRWNTWVGQLGIGFVNFFPNKLAFSPLTQWFPSWEPQVNFYYSPNYVEGDIYRFSDPAFNEFNFKTSIISSRLMLDAALTVVSRNAFSAFVIGGIGDAWSRVKYRDSMSASDPCDLIGLSVGDKDQSNFVWEVGTGLAYAFNDRINLSLEYLYTDFGSLKLSRSFNNTTLTRPQIAPSSFNLHSQAVLLGLHFGI